MTKQAQVVLLVLFVVVIGLDQVTKQFLPLLATTSRMSVGVGLAALVALGLLTRRYRSFLARGGLVLVVGAGMSNLWDVVVYGYVRDIFRINTLVFNVADVAIAVGGIFFLVSILLHSKK